MLAPTALLALALVAEIFLPYERSARRLGLSHDEREVVQRGAALASYLSPAPLNGYAPRPSPERWRRPFMRSENWLFPGILATLFAALGLADLRRRFRRQRPPETPPLGARRRIVLGALLAAALALYALGDVYTLRIDRDTSLGEWLPWATPGLWNAAGVAFLAALGSWLWLRHRWDAGALDWRAIDPWERGLVIAGILCFLLSHPLVYLPLMRVVPGMSGMRVPARYAAFVSFVVVFFAARGLDRLRAALRRPALRAALLAAAAAALAIELAPRPIHWVYVPREADFPEIDRWLATQPDVHALVELPLRRSSREARTMYLATAHWKPIVNGYSSFVPPSQARLIDRLGWFPEVEELDLLHGLGVTHLVVREPAENVRDWERDIASRVELVHESGSDRVFRLHESRPPAGGVR